MTAIFGRTHKTQAGVETLREKAIALKGASHDYDRLLERIGEARFVLIGEASHGTHEFYNERARITRRLIEEKGFQAVAVEADWPDAYRVNRYVRAEPGVADDPLAALEGFTRFPRWMWRNTVVLDFIAWLRERNEGITRREERVGFYGVDMYSLFTSIESVVRYLEKVDPEAARRARDRYNCLEFTAGGDPQKYGYATYLGMSESCENEVVEQLLELLRSSAQYASQDGQQAEDEYFHAEQNARLVVSAEEYYRSMFRGRDNTWNLRDSHMAETIAALAEHLQRQRGGQPAKIVVWEHNSHLGDARATEMGEERGEHNVGQLVRQKYGNESFLIGFSTYTGTVTAASDWDGAAERKRVRSGMKDSYEEMLHRVGVPAFMLDLRDPEVARATRGPRLQRAIGVIYRPETERWSHYFHTHLPDQFDAMLHFDETRALTPLDSNSGWEEGELPDTFPTGV